MKRAYSILRKDKIYIQSYSQTTTGLWIATGPVYIADAAHPDELGEHIRDVLNGSMVGVPHPAQDEWRAVQAPMLNAAGVKSWKTLAKGAKSIGIEYDGALVLMEPSANYENQGGTSLPEKAIECEFDSPELGHALLRAFAACT
ncbi:hypothetical protein [Burkholderia diffusa]|uniref:hypothetical protein n=1 Tax=Burkholderia diffusa TaxID=488732 RepID=UPI0012D9BD24|nr:hypothetical protein [Burkholderia diffusa]